MACFLTVSDSAARPGQEDGCPSASCTAYGHRSCPQDPIDQYLPQRSNGCEFSMYDAPGFNNITKGKTYNLDLTFQGQLINVTSNTALATNTWTTSGRIACISTSRLERA